MNARKSFEDYIFSIEGKINPAGIYKWRVETIHGPLEIDINEKDFLKNGQPKVRGIKVYSIYTRFVDVEKASQFIKDFYKDNGFVNGKWNFHVTVSGRADWEYLFSWFSTELEKILIDNHAEKSHI